MNMKPMPYPMLAVKLLTNKGEVYPLNFSAIRVTLMLHAKIIAITLFA